MDREKLKEKLKEIVKPYSQDLQALANISEDTDFIRDLKINSASLVDIVLDIEESFDIVIDNASMEKMLDVRSTLQIIEEKLASGPEAL